MGAMAVLAVVAPAVTLILVNQDCGAAWLQLWRPCTDSHQFAISVDQTVSHFQYVAPCGAGRCYQDSSGVWLQNSTADIHISTTITSHEQICRPAYVADGRCPRAVVGSLGDLYVKELVASASISPIITLLRATPQMQKLKVWVMRHVLRQSQYESRTSIDRLVFGTVLNLELPFLLGFCYPALPVLACLVVLLNAGVFYTAATYLELKIASESPARMSFKYLWGSFASGSALIMWLFIECDWHGKWLVIVGMPSCAMAGCACWNMTLWRRRSGTAVLRASLLEPLVPAEHELGVQGIALETVHA